MRLFDPPRSAPPEDAMCLKRDVPTVFFLDRSCVRVTSCLQDDVELQLDSTAVLDADILAYVREKSEDAAHSGRRENFQFIIGAKFVRMLTLDGDTGTIVIVEPVRNRSAVRDVATKYGLTARESQVLELIVRATNRNSIARLLVISETTVQTHIVNIGLKMNCTRREEMIGRALGVS